MKRELNYYLKPKLIPLIFCLLTFNYAFADNTDTIQSKDIELGKRLFYGLIITGDHAVNCASCHNTATIDTFNWNPSVVELAISTEHMDSAAFANTLLNPVTKKISEAHQNIQLNAEQIVLVRNYINSFKTSGLTEPKLLVTRLALFIFSIIIFLLAIADLAFTKIIKFKPLHGAVMLLALFFIFKIIYEDAVGLGRSQGYAPLQPIKFSHKVHATDNKIDCFYCHHSAEDAKSAGIPSTNVCLNCHELVREGTHSGRFEIQKILTLAENKQSTAWIRIHKLPDHVYFNHAQHVGVGKLDCAECHGDIKNEHLAKQHADLSMGWCLDCHRTRKVNFIGNEYYETTFKEYHKKFINSSLDSLTIAQMGGENCMKCHY
ncbi:MAG: cytochrome c peroxidase [Thiohalospira sp.]